MGKATGSLKTSSHVTALQRQEITLSLGVHTIDGLPKEPAERLALGLRLQADFITRFEYGLREADKNLWQEHGFNPPDTLAGFRIREEFDKFMLAQASVLGAWLFLIPVVQQRLIQGQHEPDGPKLIRRLGQALVLGIKASRGEARLPIDDPAYYTAKQEAVKELRALQSRLRMKVTRRLPSLEEILALVQQEVMESAIEFPRLAENLDSLLAFLRQDRIARPFVFAQVRPAPLFDRWAAWATNRDPEKVRQMISRLGGGRIGP